MTNDIEKFEGDPLILINNYIAENNSNYNTIAQVLIGAKYAEYLTFKILEVSNKVKTPSTRTPFSQNIQRLSDADIIDDVFRDKLQYIQQTRNRFAHEVGTNLNSPVAEYAEAVLYVIVNGLQLFVGEQRIAKQ